MGDAQSYEDLCHSRFGLEAFPGLLSFAKAAKEHVPEVILSVVDTIGEAEIEKCRKLAEACGVPPSGARLYRAGAVNEQQRKKRPGCSGSFLCVHSIPAGAGDGQ